MRFSSGIDQLQRENTFLKHANFALLLLEALIFGILLNSNGKLPIIVERTSHGLEILSPTLGLHTEAETKQAIALMMRARFDSDAISPEVFLTRTQLVLRDNEQKELKSRSMHQSVVVRDIAIKRDEATVEFDRVISVGDIRSALKTKVSITFEEIEPNELNPYGLSLSLADPIEPKKEK